MSKTGVQRAVPAFHRSQLLADALRRDHVGVHTHADGQNNSAMPGSVKFKLLKDGQIARLHAGGGGLTQQRNGGDQPGQAVKSAVISEIPADGLITPGNDHGLQAAAAQAPG